MKMQVSGKKILVGLGILLLMGITAGCSASEKFSWKSLAETQNDLITGKIPRNEKGDKADPAVANQQAEQQAEQVAGEENLQADKPGTNQQEEKVKTGEQASAKVKVTLYFANAEGDYLIPETRTITEITGVARATVEELIKGPKANRDLVPTLPAGTKLRDIDIHDGLATVDFSRELVDNHGGGSSGELLTVYSVVEALSQFPTVEKVQFLVEGQKVETLAGHMDLAEPVERNIDVIKKK